MKTCIICNIEKELSEFNKDKYIKSGLRPSCKDCKKIYNNKHYQNNKERKSIYHKEYYSKPENKHKISSYIKKRRKTDPLFKLRDNISSAILKALKRGKSSKAGQSCLQYLNYNIQDLKDHLEKQFDENMSWSNHGSYWNIDHIIPQNKLLYTSMSDDNFKKCWSLENLQPLERIANFRKGDKIINTY